MAKPKGIGYYVSFGFLNSNLILGNLKLLGFLSLLAIIYIANAHYAERNVRRIQILQKEIHELRWRYTSIQAEVMYNSRQSAMSEQLREQGLRPLRDQPKKIVIDP
ncbi:MAG: hypothetical protein IAE84_14675 [Saprospiraceae bacterium]|jgi:hypothetical protein|nr:hypothetical protein [Saprospiraceae bacterium]HRD80430.1 FtsL-like putative cell division protein [Saprospiraceae bacterium]HRF42368.1 FtsL-like putative cell division protein [Saprospiraceae bacterium]HRJ17030.1 FtsL-like putative cell division protein [Saprospiraceae bacterium]HRK83026.1 FtsL-like putative cell division protein [Saprospiraceae bacterium]